MRLAAILVLLVLFAGCLTPITDRLRASDVEAPLWDVGDWWRYTIESGTSDVAGEVTVVVADVLPTGYVLGIPEDAEANAALLYHMPAIGPVGRDLSWDVHETRFEPARWPLTDGEEWDTTWIVADVRLSAKVNGTTWTIDNAGQEDAAGMLYELVYDPSVKWFTSFVRTDLEGVVRQSIQLVENGTGYSGTLRAPQFIDVVFLDSRTRGVIAGGLPAAPNPKFTPAEDIDTLLVGCLVGGAPGQYHAEVISPQGGICVMDETIPPGDTRTRAQVLEVPAQGIGEWEARLFAGGAGAATVEVLGWPTLNFTLSG